MLVFLLQSDCPPTVPLILKHPLDRQRPWSQICAGNINCFAKRLCERYVNEYLHKKRIFVHYLAQCCGYIHKKYTFSSCGGVT